MTRTTAREIAVQLIYAMDVSGLEPAPLLDSFFEKEYYGSLSGEDQLYSSRPNKKQVDYVRELVTLTGEHLDDIDAYIEKYARGWKRERISRTAMACLRCALCEIEYMSEVTPQVAINEAVELCKGYDETETVSFVNGILGSFMRGEKGQELPEGDDARAKAASDARPDDEQADDDQPDQPDDDQQPDQQDDEQAVYVDLPRLDMDAAEGTEQEE